jgi:aryl-alcohol dehydrogenase-like predicted oxidoreductase
VPFAPLGRGFLAGSTKPAEEYPASDWRHSDPRFQGAHYEENVHATETLRQMAHDKGVTPAQLAIAWVLHKGDDIVPIPGTKRRTYLEENVAAAASELTPVEVERLDAARAFAGPRYNERLMQFIDR